MTNYEEVLMQKVHIEHIEMPEEILFSVDSFTTPDVQYMVTADFTSGILRCNCPDARGRRKIMDFTDSTGFPCKHMRAVALVVKPFYDAALRGLFKEKVGA